MRINPVRIINDPMKTQLFKGHYRPKQEQVPNNLSSFAMLNYPIKTK